MVDKLLLGRKVSDLETYLDQIREFSKISVAAVVSILHEDLRNLDGYKKQ